MPHYQPAASLDVIFERVATVTAPVVAFAAAQVSQVAQVLPDLPGWLNGSVAGLLILALVYAIRWVTHRMEKAESALSAFKDKQIVSLTQENALLRQQLDDARKLAQRSMEGKS